MSLAADTLVPGVRGGWMRRPGAAASLVMFGALALLSVLPAVGVGAVAISPLQAVGILLDACGLSSGVAYAPDQAAVLLAVRLPRVLLGVVVGGTLGMCGAALQSLFRNPLADPGVLGVSSGASLGACLAVVIGFSGVGFALPAAFEPYAISLAAFLGALVVTGFVALLVRSRAGITTVLLVGIAISALAGAATGVLTFVATDEQLRSITFWSLGSLAGATWTSLAGALPFIVPALLLLPFTARSLDALALGEREAEHLGVRVVRVRRAVVLLSALAVGAAVAATGGIGFIALVSPHLVRMIAGPRARITMIGGALVGAALLVLADLTARTVVAPAELPIGVVTAIIGTPVFLWLVLRAREGSER